MMRGTVHNGDRMKWIMTVLLAAFVMLMAFAAPVYAEEDVGDEANEHEEGSEEAGEAEEESTPGFEVAFAAAAALAAARILKARML